MADLIEYGDMLCSACGEVVRMGGASTIDDEDADEPCDDCEARP